MTSQNENPYDISFLLLPTDHSPHSYVRNIDPVSTFDCVRDKEEKLSVKQRSKILIKQRSKTYSNLSGMVLLSNLIKQYNF